MPITTLEFTLPEEADEFSQGLNAGKYLAMLHDIRDKIRSVKKYGPEITFDEFVEWLEQNEFYEVCGL